jgi:hypothetical protein
LLKSPGLIASVKEEDSPELEKFRDEWEVKADAMFGRMVGDLECVLYKFVLM